MKRIPGESISGKLSEVWRSMCSQRVLAFSGHGRYYSPRSFLASYLAIKFTVPRISLLSLSRTRRPQSRRQSIQSRTPRPSARRLTARCPT